MGRLPQVGLAALVLASLFLHALSCREATEISVQLVTDVPCPQVSETEVSAMPPDRSSARSAATTACDSVTREIGSIVLVPSRALDEKVLIEAKTRTVSPDGTTPPCTEGSPQCIVARRLLRFRPHQPLPLTIEMHQVCAGITCGADQSCGSDGVCYIADVEQPGYTDNPGDARVPTPTTDGGQLDAAPIPVPDAATGPPCTPTATLFDTALLADTTALAVTTSEVFWIQPDSTGARYVYKKARNAGAASPTAVPATRNAAHLAATDTALYWYDDSTQTVFSLDKTGPAPQRVVSTQAIQVRADPAQGPNPYTLSATAVYGQADTVGVVQLPTDLAVSGTQVWVTSSLGVYNLDRSKTGQVPAARFAPSDGGALTNIRTRGVELFWLDPSANTFRLYNLSSGALPLACNAFGAQSMAVNTTTIFLHTDAGLFAQKACSGNPTPVDISSQSFGYAIVARDDCVYYFAADAVRPTPPMLRVVSAP